MKSMQRTFGKAMKRSENQQDTQQVLAEFQAVDDMLDRVGTYTIELLHLPQIY